MQEKLYTKEKEELCQESDEKLAQEEVSEEYLEWYHTHDQAP
jgi:hypothetical protein